MTKLIAPAVAIMNRLKYKGKFTLLGAIATIAIAVLTYQLVNQSRSITLFSEKELDGVSYINPLITVMQNFQIIRQLQQLQVSNNFNEKNNLIDAMEKVNASIQSADSTQAIYGQALDSTNEWRGIKNQWVTIKDSQSNNFAILTNIISHVQKLIVNACDKSNLTLDPDINTYYTMDNYCNNIPIALEESALIRDIGTQILLTKNITSEDREKLIVLDNLLDKFNKTQINSNIDKVLLDTPSLIPLISLEKDAIIAKITSLSNLLQATILAGKLDMQAQEFNNQFTFLIQDGYKLENISGSILTNLLNIRVNRYVKNLYLNVSVAIVSLILLVYLFVAIYSSIISSIRNLVEGTHKLAKGDLNTFVQIDTQDELKQVAISFNQMRDTLSKIVDELQLIVSNANEGDLSKRIDASDQCGFGKDLIDAVNLMCDNFQMVIKDVTIALNHLANGNLTTEITHNYQGTFGELKTFMNMTTDSLEKLINNIKHSTKTINTAAKEISQANFSLAKRTDQEAAFLEETSASIEELTITVKRNAKNAVQANELAKTASEVALKGGTVVNQVVETMSEINESSRKVADIIGVIDSIAFQTNILALNAAVEAARAGEQGRGFAVVATEVRNLAQRTLTAAKEIKLLISDSVESVSNGTTFVNQAGQTMDELLKAVNQVTDIIHEITIASSEQSNGIEQVNIAIAQMDKVTQENNAMVEATVQTAKSLEVQTQKMDELVNIFKLHETSAKEQKTENTTEEDSMPYIDKSKKEIWSEF